MEIRTEIYCHECNGYVRFTLDDSLNGNHIITCPNCGHEHCRVIKDGKVTGDRWSSRNGQTYYVSSSTTTFTATSSELTYAGSSISYYQWSSAASNTTGW